MTFTINARKPVPSFGDRNPGCSTSPGGALWETARRVFVLSLSECHHCTHILELTGCLQSFTNVMSTYQLTPRGSTTTRVSQVRGQAQGGKAAEWESECPTPRTTESETWEVCWLWLWEAPLYRAPWGIKNKDSQTTMSAPSALPRLLQVRGERGLAERTELSSDCPDKPHLSRSETAPTGRNWGHLASSTRWGCQGLSRSARRERLWRRAGFKPRTSASFSGPFFPAPPLLTESTWYLQEPHDSAKTRAGRCRPGCPPGKDVSTWLTHDRPRHL